MTLLEMIEEIRAGRNVQSAEESLYAVVRAVLLHRLDRRIPPHLRSRLDAEDVLHEAFIRAMGAIDRFSPQGDQSFVAWVYRIAKNAIYDAGHRHSAITPHLVDDGEQGGPRASQVADLGARATEVYRLREWCEWALDRLSPEDRQVVRLREIDGRSYEEIAEACGSTPAAVRQRHSRAMQKLREIAAREKKSQGGPEGFQRES